MNELSDEVALVTGATSGLGRRFAAVLASAGARVVISGRREDRLKEVVEEITASGGRCEAVPFDVADAHALPGVMDEVEALFGLVTVLVNNAGINDARRPHKIPLELVDAVIDTNLRGPFVLSCEVAKRLIAAERGGRIVNISSMGSFDYHGNAAALYSTTKAAVNRMTETLAVEWARHGINVNAIAPGAFATEMMDGMIERVGDPSGAFPRKRLGDPAQLDTSLLYLVSPASEFVTGTVIKVDDGQMGR
ncbi:SDR family NAD(P)-dependent oxidoreductase [Amycolatopsis acidicola]|uniref:SDR family NAD(P)-dependent oxidoreductase n=1 Tax=Amycolatopsis acidicola TaxID=2596893 RepID=A0A5N0UWV1_9PSEU|nr:SDR family NAD(P)-dependent oxidoreductase [Amycolatopsis acidicola]KAA9156764.1 SDR family NAD(P)-dependent oxidoreductase [Amycolatopsis acidicola]